MRSSNILQCNVEIHADIICLLPITVHMTRSYLNLEPVWFQSCLQHTFENSIWFENLANQIAGAQIVSDAMP